MWHRAALGVAFALLLAGCRSGPTGEVSTPPAAPRDTTAAPATKYRIAVVPKGVAHQFWTTVKAGADAAAAEEQADVLWKGPDAETDIATQKGIIEDFITQKVDAIVMAACDADALVPTVLQAQQANIPVITIDSGVNTEVISHVATDNVAGGRIAGETLFQLIDGKGEVGLIPFVQGAASSEDREKGFKEAVKANIGIKLVATDYSDSDVGKAKDVTADMLTAHPNLVGIFAANEPGAIGAANAISERGKADQIKLVAFDGSPDEVKLLEEGVIHALVVQDPFKMGYQGVKQALRAIRGETCEPRVDTGVTVVTKQNLHDPEVQKLLNPTAGE